MRFFLQLLFLCVVSATHLAASESAAILVYHHVAADTPPSTSISPENFIGHLEYLRDNNFTVMKLPELLAALEQKQPLPDKAVAITFDDGYISIYDTAFPLLQEFGYPFTLFVSTGPIDRQQRNFMSWQNIKEMSDAGVTIANHLVEHPYMLTRLDGESEGDWLARLRSEILAAQRSIAQHTGQEHRLLAYPYGEYDNNIKDLILNLGFTGLAQNSGAVGFNSDPAALPRFPLASIYANLETAKIKFASKAFNVRQIAPLSPVSSNPRPVARLKFLPGDYQLAQIACFSNGEPMEMSWSEQEEGLLEIVPKSDITGRRSRYICTAPDIESDRYYWYSVQWINPSV